MGLWPVFLDVLPDLKLFELSDHPRPQKKADQKGREAGINGSECNVFEDIKKGYT